MAQATIGNLNVRLGLDSAEFAAGAKRAQGALGGLASSLKGFAAGMAGALSLGAVTAAIKTSVDRMDELGKAAQKIGIPVDELSKLEYAARLADVPLGDLTTTVARFSRSLAEIQSGETNDAAAALSALGISATDAQGKLRPTSDIITDIASEFEVMRDGAGKTALAIALFGKSGADMIPLLNGGRDAIKGAGDELARFGGVVSEEVAVAAENFNDNLTRLQAAGQGLTQQVAAALLPAMNNLTDAMVKFAGEGTVAQQVADAIGFVMTEAAKGAVFLSQAFTEVAELMQFIADASGRVMNGDLGGISEDWTASQERVRKALEQNKALIDEINGKIQTPTSYLKGDLPSAKRVNEAPVLPDTAEAERRAKEAASALKKQADEAARALERVKDEGQAVWEQTRTPLEKYQLEIRRLNELMQAGAIDHDTYSRAVKQLQDDFAGAAETGSELDQVGQTLASTFSSWISNALDGTFELTDALKGLAVQLSDQFIQQAMSGIFGGGATGGGLLSGLFGGFGGGTPAFQGFYAKGGNIDAGRWGIAGEAGLELVERPRAIMGPATVTPLSELRSGNGGGDTININVNLSGANGNAEVARIAEQAVRKGLTEYQRQRPTADVERRLRAG